MNNKTVFVKAKFKPVGKMEKTQVPTGETKKGLLGGEKIVTRTEDKWVQTGFSDCEVDGGRLQEDVQAAIEELNKNGYDIISLTQVTSGNYSWNFKETGMSGNSGGYGYGYGYSYTEGVLILARKPN